MAAANGPIILISRKAIPRRAKIVDRLHETLRELYFVEHPHEAETAHFDKEALRSFIALREKNAVFVYYPWLYTAVRVPHEGDYYRLRTARNRNLITEEEQTRYRNSIVGVAGLSVGSWIVAALVATGGPKRMKLADPDTIAATNLNRINARLTDIGRKKTAVTAEQAWEVDPFLKLEVWERGIEKRSVGRFVTRPRLDLCIDEMDSIELKVLLREECKRQRVPVVMATDNGDGVILDVERFDLEPKRPLFHGRVELSELARAKTREEFVRLSSAIIGESDLTIRQRESLREVGRSLSGVAQLASAAMLSGAVGAFAARQIVNGYPLASGRYVVDSEQVLARPAGISRRRLAQE